MTIKTPEQIAVDQTELTTEQAELLTELGKLWSAAKEAGLIAGDYIGVTDIEEEVRSSTDDYDKEITLRDAALAVEQLQIHQALFGFITSEDIRDALGGAGLI